MKIAAVKTHSKSPAGSGNNQLRAVDYWRTISPLRAVAKATGWQVDELDGEKSYDFTKYDLVWFSYMDNPVPLIEMRDLGIRTTVDFDDDFFNLSPFNPVSHQYPKSGKEFRTIQWLIKNAEHLTVSTNHLARVYSKFRDPNLPAPYVLENRINPSFYPKITKKPHEGIVFTWQGGLTHHADLFHTPFWGAMSFILGKYPSARLRVMGGIPDDFFSQLDQVEYFEGAGGYEDFTKILGKFYEDADVALCPLEDNLFNASKSSIKAQEALIYDLQVVAANVQPYQELASKMAGITLVETTKEWIEALEKCIHDRTPFKADIKQTSLDTYVERYVHYIEAVVAGEPINERAQLPVLKKENLNIILSCIQFNGLTGSELYTFELARALKSLGHNITIVSECGGELADKAKAEGIDCEGWNDIPSLSPDLIISSHFEGTSLLASTFACPIINVIHSENELLWPIERPVKGCDQYVVVRDTIKNKVVKEGIHPDLVHVIGNPIDFTRFNTEKTSSNKTLLFIGPMDTLRKRVIRDIKKVAAEKGLEAVFVGRDQPNPPMWYTEKLTKKCEMVASIYVGRTAIEGWACGKAALIYDVNARGKILSKYIVVPPKDIEKYNSVTVAKQLLALVVEGANA